MKTINIAPTWLWVAKMYFVALETNSPKAARGFRAELLRLGPEAKRLLAKQDKNGLYELCARIDKR